MTRPEEVVKSVLTDLTRQVQALSVEDYLEVLESMRDDLDMLIDSARHDVEAQSND